MKTPRWITVGLVLVGAATLAGAWSATGALTEAQPLAPALAWHTERVDGETTDTGHYTAIDLDVADHPWISTYNESLGTFDVAYWDGTSWEVTTLDDNAPVYDAGEGTALVVDASGYPHVVYHNAFSYTLQYAVYNGKTWSVERDRKSVGRERVYCEV